MDLPDVVVSIIRDFSRPLTRYDWRQLHRMTTFAFHCDIASAYNHFDFPVLTWFIHNYDQLAIRYWFYTSTHRKPYLQIRL